MAMTARTTMVGVFHNRAQADVALAALRSAGFRDDQIGFAMRTESDIASVNPDALIVEDHDTGSNAAGGALTGAIAGGATAALIVPVIGPVIAGGILAAALVGAAIGAATGGILGSLVKLDVSEDDARYYEDEIRAGRGVVIVHAEDRAEEAAAILHSAGAYDVDALGKTTMAETAQAQGMGGREAFFAEPDNAVSVHASEDSKEIEHTGRPQDAHTDHLAEERMEWEGKQAS